MVPCPYHVEASPIHGYDAQVGQVVPLPVKRFTCHDRCHEESRLYAYQKEIDLQCKVFPDLDFAQRAPSAAATLEAMSRVASRVLLQLRQTSSLWE
jgi:hypothetical protein